MTKWQRFRSWRRSRPFWGGVLTVLAGLEIIGSMNVELHGGNISLGQEGFPAYLIAFVLIVIGPLAWFAPMQRHFYGLVATFVAVYSLLGVNLGGYFVGMLLGVTGGGLIFAWNPETSGEEVNAQAVPAEDDASEDNETEVLEGIHLRDGVPAQRPVPDDEQPVPKDNSPRHAAMMIMVVALSVSMLAVIGAQAGAGATSAAAGPCPTASAKPSPSPSPTSGGGGIIGGIIDWFGRLIGGGTASPSPSPTPKPTASPTPCPTPTGGPGGPGAPGPSGSPAPGVPGAPGAKPQPKLLAIPAIPGLKIVGKRPSKMTGSRVSMVNLVYRGVVDMPTHDGVIRSLYFTMDRSDTNDFLLHVFGDNGNDTDLRSSQLTVRGGEVHFFTSRFRGNLFGLLPVDYTPENQPPPIPLPLVFFTNPDVDLVWVNSTALDAPDLTLKAV